MVQKIIYNELCLGEIKDTLKKVRIRIIENIVVKRAKAVILGYTGVPLLIKQEDVKIPIFDTTTIYTKRAALEAIKYKLI